MSYELFRNSLITRLADKLTNDILEEVIRDVDAISQGYKFIKQTTDIIPLTGIPEIVKAYLVSKSIENVSKGTLKQYRYKLLNFFNTVRKPFNTITTNDIRLYLYNYKEQSNASDRYMETIRITINSFFEWTVTNEYLDSNPCAKIEHIKFQEKEREPLTTYELEVLRYHCQDIREKALIDFLFSTGCRVSECAAAQMSDINWDDRSILIRHGKGNKSRYVYFNAESELTLREYLKTRDDSTDAIFVSTKKPHQALQNHAIENIIKKISERCGIHAYPHKLRHTFATSGLRGGMPLEKLQKLMGHTKPDTTLIYAKLEQDDLKREHQRVYA